MNFSKHDSMVGKCLLALVHSISKLLFFQNKHWTFFVENNFKGNLFLKIAFPFLFLNGILFSTYLTFKPFLSLSFEKIIRANNEAINLVFKLLSLTELRWDIFSKSHNHFYLGMDQLKISPMKIKILILFMTWKNVAFQVHKHTFI